MHRTELAHKLRQQGESVTLSFHNALHTEWLYGLYHGEETVRQKLPLLCAAWDATANASPDEALIRDGFVDDNGINVINWHRENNTLIIEATTSLTEAAIFIDEHLEVRTAAGEIVAGFSQSTLGVNHTTLLLKTDFDPKQFKSDVLELDFTSNWAVASTGLLKASMSSRDIHTSALLSSNVKAVHLLQPVKKVPSRPFPINVCYSRWPIPAEDVDYIYRESFDPSTKQQWLFAPLSAWVEFTDNSDPFLDIDMSTFSLKMDCQSGIAKYTKTGRETLISAHFCKGPDKSTSYPNGFFFELDPDWKEIVPSARLPKRDKVDVFFSVQYICQSGQVGNIQISSIVTGTAAPNVAQCGWLNLLWGCLAKGTKITMADGSVRPIEDVSFGSFIAGEGGYPVRVENIIMGMEYEPLVVLHTVDGKELHCTFDHPMVTPDGIVKASDLTGISKLYDNKGKELELDGIWSKQGNHTVYNLHVAGGRFYAEGLLVGDFVEQGKLGNAPMALSITEGNPYFKEYELKCKLWGI